MSTVDPMLAVQERAARVPSTLRVAITLGVMFLGGFAAGWGAGALVTSIVDTAIPPASALLALITGMIVSIITSIIWMALVLRRGDLGFMAGVAASLLGAGSGLLIATWPAPEAPRVLVIIGAALVALAAVALILSLVGVAARRRSAARLEAAVREGSVTTATVTDKGYTAFTDSSRIFTTVTFSFTDPAGVQRWVQRQLVVHAKDPLVEGHPTRLWFDPANPGDDSRIVVELARDNPLRPAPSR